MEKIKIPTRKDETYKEFTVVKDFLKTRAKFTTDQLTDYFKSSGMNLTEQRRNIIIGTLVARKKAIKPIAEHHGGIGRPQTYVVVNNNIEVYPPKGSEIKQKKLPLEKVAEKEVLTLEDVERIGEMDLAFIGYTIRTEAEILYKKYESSLIQLKKAQEELKTQAEQIEEMKKNHMAEIQTLVKHQKQEKDSLEKKIDRQKDLELTVRNLNNRISNQNMIIDNLKRDIAHLEKIKVTRGDKTFKLGEVAKFTNNKPPHLT